MAEKNRRKARTSHPEAAHTREAAQNSPVTSEANIPHTQRREEDPGFEASLVTTALTGIAVAVLRPSWLPGMAIGVAATMAPRLLPVIGGAMRPLIELVVRAGYATAMKTQEIAAEASEQWEDIVAEARAAEEQGEPVSIARRRARRRAAA